MDQKRLMLAIALSLGIMLVFQFAFQKYMPHPVTPPAQTAAKVQEANGTPATAGAPGTAPAVAAGPRLDIEAAPLTLAT